MGSVMGFLHTPLLRWESVGVWSYATQGCKYSLFGSRPHVTVRCLQGAGVSNRGRRKECRGATIHYPTTPGGTHATAHVAGVYWPGPHSRAGPPVASGDRSRPA